MPLSKLSLGRLKRSQSWKKKKKIAQFWQHFNLPSQWANKERELEEVLLGLTLTPYTFLLPLNECCQIDVDSRLKQHLIIVDNRLHPLSKHMIPSLVTEESFWKSYFYFVNTVMKNKNVENVERHIRQLQDHAMRSSKVVVPAYLLEIKCGKQLDELSGTHKARTAVCEPPVLINTTKEEPSCTTSDQRAKICSTLPVRLQKKPWKLMYSTQEHGISLATLLRNLHESGESILIVQTTKGYILGAFLGESWTNTDKFYGNGETRLFTLAGKQDIQSYKWTKKNPYLVRSNPTSGITFGADDSGNCGLFISPNLLQGRSHACPTFGNTESLIGDPSVLHSTSDESHEHFDILTVEVWGFYDRKSSKDEIQ